MKELLTEWRKFLKEAVKNNKKNRNRLAAFIASGLPEDQQPGFIKSETRKMMDDAHFEKQWDAYAEDMLEAGQ
tara:strand:- start:255 stop:473 length:219 start_codon:yes stop_codon:yes gene_type:complete